VALLRAAGVPKYCELKRNPVPKAKGSSVGWFVKKVNTMLSKEVPAGVIKDSP
jgi:hypothetical protein